MKRLSVFIISVLLIGTTPLLAQDFSVTWGKEFKESRRTVVLDLVGQNDAGFYVLKGRAGRGYSDCELQQFDHDMNPVATTPLPLEFGDKDMGGEFCWKSGSGVFMFSSAWSRSEERKELFYQKIQPQRLAPQKDFVKVSEVPFRNRFLTGHYDYSFSSDSSHVLIYANIQARKREPEQYAFYVFDSKMNPLWDKRVTLPYAENLFSVEDYTVDNEGNVYVLGIKYEKRPVAKRKGEPNFVYKVLNYSKEGEKAVEYDISPEDYFLTDMRIDISPQRDIICAGFYSERGTWSVKGTYFLKVDRGSKGIIHESFKEFDIDFITMNYTKRQEAKAKKRKARGKQVEMYEYDMDAIIPRADGGAVLVAEQYYMYVTTSYNASSNTYNTTYHYIYNDIIVCSIDPQGDIEWNAKIPKRQHSINDNGYYSSYARMVTGDKLYFIYNDSRKNIEVEKQGKYKNYQINEKNGIVMVASVDTEGNVERKTLFSNLEVEAITVPKVCRQISEEQMILFARRRKKTQFALLEVE